LLFFSQLTKNLAVAHYFNTLLKIDPPTSLTSTTLALESTRISQLRALACQLQSSEQVTQPEHL